MLKELIEDIGLQGTSFKEVESKFKLKSCYCIKVKANELEDMYIKDDEEMQNLELKEFFKTRYFYSQYVNSQKAVSIKSFGKKIIMSYTDRAVIFNFNSFVNKLAKLKKDKKIDEDATVEWLIKDTIISFYEALKVDKSLILDKIDMIIEKILKANPVGSKCLICLDENLEDYVFDYGEYMKSKIFDDKSVAIYKSGEYAKYKEFSSFANSNNNKPLLKRVGVSNIYHTMYTADEGIENYKLLSYASNNFKSKNFIKGRIINWDAKDKNIVYSDYNPYITLDKDKGIHLVVRSVIETAKQDEITINSYGQAVREINKYLDFILTKDSSDLNSNKKIIANKYKHLIEYSKFVEKGESVLIVNKGVFIKTLEKLMNDTISYNFANKRINYVVNLKIIFEDYFLRKGRIKEMCYIKDSFKEKILDKNLNEFDSEKEMMFAAGQLAKHLCQYSEGDNYYKLITRYSKATSYEQVLKLLKRDKDKYSYKIKSNREERIYNMILTYITINELKGKFDKENKVWFLIGQTDKDRFFEKNKNNIEDSNN